MQEKKKTTNNSAFYIALCCCVGIIGFVGYFTNRNASEKVVSQQVLEEPQKRTPTTEQKEEKEVKAEKTNPTETEEKPLPTLSPVIEKTDDSISVSAQADKPDESHEINMEDENLNVLEKGEPEEFYEGETVESVSINPDPSFILPVNGEICEKFSGDSLIYNKALDDYRTHNGIDIKAKAGSEVLVSADGVIDQVYTDYLGNTVIISHDNGFKTKYSCLDNTDNLAVGTEVTQGSLLSKISSKSSGENITDPHIHFELIKNEEFVNPEDYIE